MESVGQNYGFLLYRTQIPQKFANTNVELEILGLRDRGIILVGQVRELFLFTICENLKEISHQPRTMGENRREPIGENPGNEVALTSPIWKQEGNWAELTDFRKVFWDCYKAKEKFRPFPSYPELLFQTEAECKAVGIKMILLFLCNSKMAYWPIGANS